MLSRRFKSKLVPLSTTKNYNVEKENCSTVRVPSHVLKAFEKIMYSVDAFTQDKVSNLLAGFGEKHKQH